MIHEAHLKKAGWSPAEIAHAKRIIADANAAHGKALHAVEHATLVLLTVLIIIGSSAAGMAIARLSNAVSWMLAAGASLTIGAVIGALSQRALRTLRAVPAHARVAVAAIIVAGASLCATGVWIAHGAVVPVAAAFALGLAASLAPAGFAQGDA